MTDAGQLKEIRENVWEAGKGTFPAMRVPARIYIDREMLESISEDKSIDQLLNVATLPGVQDYVLAMPDIHQGYGFPVGGVAAVRTEDGVISPGGIGYDINCGVRLLCTQFDSGELKRHLKDLASQIQRDVPSGVGRGGYFALKETELEQVLNTGMQWALKRGYATSADIDATEEAGHYKQAQGEFVSKEAKKRGHDQLGTMGSGNHFVEVQRVSKIFEPQIADAYGLFPGQVCVMIHTGSRGLGHQCCTDYVRRMNQVMLRYNISLPDRELACAPFKSEEGQEYFRAMAGAANFAWVNRQLITYQIRNAFKQVLRTPGSDELRLLYDVSHNIAKIESYHGVECVVHRKGSTRAFGPGRKEIPPHYREIGQPVLIPGSMGTSSYVLCGTERAMQETFGSCCHGAGRALSRTRAKKTLDYNKLLNHMQGKGIEVRGASAHGLLEEAPEAYKDVDKVVRIVEQTGIAKIVAKLMPLAVIKG